MHPEYKVSQGSTSLPLIRISDALLLPQTRPKAFSSVISNDGSKVPEKCTKEGECLRRSVG